MAKNSTSTSSVTSSVMGICNHEPCHLLTSFTLDNPGKWFFHYPLREHDGDCHCFEWFEKRYSGRVRELLVQIITNKRWLEKDIKGAEALIDVLNVKIKSSEVEIDGFPSEVCRLNECNAIIEFEGNKLRLENHSLNQQLM